MCGPSKLLMVSYSEFAIPTIFKDPQRGELGEGIHTMGSSKNGQRRGKGRQTWEATQLRLRSNGWTRLGGVVGRRAEAQMRVVVDEACDDDANGVGVLGEDWDPQGEHARPKYQDPKKGGWWWYEFKEDVVEGTLAGSLPDVTEARRLVDLTRHERAKIARWAGGKLYRG
ncbi:hypothetical protein BGW80DRAFT_1254616 [Lactifluus volemus]|nr:hypothetical protein BGW80DRAFT_1254616 [Lactifluus volemus]